MTPLFLSPFCEEATIAKSLVWMSAIGALWLLLEPSRKSDEMLHDARLRVAGALVRDPLFWFFVVIALLSGLRALNGGMERIYDPSVRRWLVTAPPCGFFPGCATGSGFLSFATILALGVVVEGCRLALGKSARTAFAATFSIAAASGGVAAAIANLHSEDLVSSPGLAFGFAFLASIVAAAGIFECRWQRYLLLFSFAMGGSATGLFYFSTPPVLFSFAVAGVLFIAGSAAYLAICRTGADVARFLVVVVVSAVVPVLLGICTVDSEVTRTYGAVAMTMAEFPDNLFGEGFWERRAALSDFAATFWRENMWTGTGVGTYPLQLWISGGSAKGLASQAPLNGWWLLLSERGIIGAIALAVPFAFMLYSLLHRAWIAIRFRRAAFFPLVALGIVAPMLVAADGLVDSSAMRPDAILAAFALFALAASSLPIPRLLGKGGNEEDVKGEA